MDPRLGRTLLTYAALAYAALTYAALTYAALAYATLTYAALTYATVRGGLVQIHARGEAAVSSHDAGGIQSQIGKLLCAFGMLDVAIRNAQSRDVRRRNTSVIESPVRPTQGVQPWPCGPRSVCPACRRDPNES